MDLAETAPDDRQNGEEFWSAGEEFCSCHSDEEEDGSNIECRTWNDDGDDNDYKYCISSPLGQKRDDESGAYMKNTKTQYDLQHSSESADEKNGDEKRPRPQQHSSQNDVSKSEPEWNSQSTRNRAIKDCISSDKLNSEQAVACQENIKSGSLENIMRIRSLENNKSAGERNIGVSTKRVGLVIGNRQLSSEACPTVSSMTEYDDQSGFSDPQKDKSAVQSKYDHMCPCNRADKILRGHQVHDQRAPKQTEQLVGDRDERYAQRATKQTEQLVGDERYAQIAHKQTEQLAGDERYAQSLSYNNQKPPKKDTKGQAKSSIHGKQNGVPESSRDQSGARGFLRDEVPQNNLPINHLRDDEEDAREKRDQHFINWKNQNLEGKLDDETHALSGNSFLREEVPQNDLPINHLRNDAKRSLPSKRTNQNSKGNLDDETQISHERHTQKAAINPDGSIQSPLNDLPTNLRIDDEDSTPPLIRTIQNLERNFHDETQAYSLEKRTQKAGIKYSRGSTFTVQNDLPTKLRNDEDSTPTLIRTFQNFEGKVHDKTHERRWQKADIKRPSRSSSTSQNELPSNLRNDHEGSTPPFIQTDHNYQGKLDDMHELHEPCQQKEETELAASIESSSKEVPDVKTDFIRAEMDSTLATDASVSIRGNMELSSTGSHKKYFFDMWMKGKFCDVNIVVDDHAFLAHRVVLAANSEYFENFFLNSPPRTDLLTVYVTDMSADVFRVILRYMYTGHVDIEFSQVSHLLRGSLFLTIESLTNALQDFLLNTWKGQCIGAFCLAQTAGLHDLYKEILNYIRIHFVEVSSSEHFALCPVEHASSILSDDNLWISEETDVLYAVLLWLEHHARDTSSNLRLLRHVRFEYIPLAIIDRIEKSHLNSIANDSVKRYIQDARKRTSCLEIDQLHFDPPIIRQRIAEVTECRTVRTKDSESIESTKSDLSFKKSDKEKRISPSKEEQPSSHTQCDRSFSPCQKSPSSSKASHSMMKIAVPFPSYHEIDTTPIRVSVSQDVSASPVASNEDLGELNLGEQEYAENETNVQVVRIGGISRTWKDDCVHSDIEKLEYRPGKRWEQWASFAEIPVAMHHHVACYIHNSIYISGGHVQLPCDAHSNYFQPSCLFHVYDLLKRKWYRLKDLEQARVFHQMVALFGQVYVIGGQGRDGGALSAVERYSPYTDSWRQAAPLSFPRYATAATAYNFHLWVAGGATNHVTGQVTSQNADDGQQSDDESGDSVYDGFYKSASTFLTGVVECYSPHNNSWTKINGLPTPRCHASLLRIKKRLYLVGGFCCIRHFPTEDVSTSSVDVYDDVTESWRYVTDVGEGNYSANTIAVGSKIVILGKPGPFLESGGDIISIYDTLANKWELRRSLLLESRVGHACCAIPVSLHSSLRQM